MSGKKPEDVDNLDEARRRRDFVHHRSGGPDLPRVASGPRRPKSPLLWGVVVVIAGLGLIAAFVLGSIRSLIDTEPGADELMLTRPSGALRLTVFARKGGVESEVQSSDVVSGDVQLIPHITASKEGWLLIAHVDPKGVVTTVFPTGTGGRASSPGKDKGTQVPPLDAGSLARGFHHLYLVQGDTVFDTQGWRARPDGIRVAPPNLRVVSFAFERR